VKQLFRASSDRREMREACQVWHYTHWGALYRVLAPLSGGTQGTTGQTSGRARSATCRIALPACQSPVELLKRLLLE
jgi:hypothetical protein